MLAYLCAEGGYNGEEGQATLLRGRRRRVLRPEVALRPLHPARRRLLGRGRGRARRLRLHRVLRFGRLVGLEEPSSWLGPRVAGSGLPVFGASLLKRTVLAHTVLLHTVLLHTVLPVGGISSLVSRGDLRSRATQREGGTGARTIPVA